ncbi:hypothetical protein PROFUN_07810 [Planoprotostelium fungivorum]|uniref:AAA+ ATPase domain-containing protein n=1 Tax=Planoprotostelium fungivorum TaxID=1890364 RepID=A0A2P6MX65_9EUKA|nr:hypothetical protein PROFUN_07810 [Planoprotostelium fungivorum]
MASGPSTSPNDNPEGTNVNGNEPSEDGKAEKEELASGNSEEEVPISSDGAIITATQDPPHTNKRKRKALIITDPLVPPSMNVDDPKHPRIDGQSGPSEPLILCITSHFNAETKSIDPQPNDPTTNPQYSEVLKSLNILNKYIFNEQRTIYAQLFATGTEPNVIIDQLSFPCGGPERSSSSGMTSHSNVIFQDPEIPHHLFTVTTDETTLRSHIESHASGTHLYLNGNHLKRGARIPIREGDHIVVNGGRSYSFTFGQGPNRRGETSGRSTPLVSRGLRLLEETPLKRPSMSEKMQVRDRERQTLKEPAPVTSTKDKAVGQEAREKFRDFFLELFAENSAKERLVQADVTFDHFPYYVNENTKQMLIHTGFMYLKTKPELYAFLSNLPISRKISLCGPTGTEMYQESLVYALANHLGASVAILDQQNLTKILTTVNSQNPNADTDSSDETTSRDHPLHRLSSGRSMGLDEDMTKTFKIAMEYDDLMRKRLGQRVKRKSGEKSGEKNVGRHIRSAFEVIFEILSKEGKPYILYLKEAETIASNRDQYTALKEEMKKIASPIIIIGSHAGDPSKSSSGKGLFFHTKTSGLASLLDHLETKMDMRSGNADIMSGRESTSTSKSSTTSINKLLNNRINVIIPPAGPLLEVWNKQITSDMENVKKIRNTKNIQHTLASHHVICHDDLTDITGLSKIILCQSSVDSIVGYAVSHHIFTRTIEDEAKIEQSKLVIDKNSIRYALEAFNDSESDHKAKSLKNVDCENDFERKLISEVIPPSELNLAFNDIGALDEVKQTLKELVMLPLQRPELFTRGALTKPCKGILLFGPPGTGKTMLAKAVATQSGANFINVSMSTIASKWFGEGEKYVKAIFTLASKISPTVIFIDELDSMLGKREKNGEHEAMRKIKNEFMSYWDGLRTKDKERVLVLAATNRPFDLDDAVLRRLSRRILIDLPSVQNRLKILKVILSKEEMKADVDLEGIAKMTEGFSGSDLKNLCVAAAYQPIREIIQKEKKEAAKSGMNPEEAITSNSGPVKVRLLCMKDFEKSLNEVSASVSEDASSVSELRRWNEIYGEGGSRKKESLPYYL